MPDSYRALRKLEVGSEDSKTGFFLPEHIEKSLTADRSAEIFADYFSKISQEFEPLNTEKLPPWIIEELQNGRQNQTKPAHIRQE